MTNCLDEILPHWGAPATGAPGENIQRFENRWWESFHWHAQLDVLTQNVEVHRVFE
jgi:hypothetical protein